MGNLNSPTVNRWGINVFWTKMWYAERNFASNLHQDKIFTVLLNTYLRFGLYVFKDMFHTPYWHMNQAHTRPFIGSTTYLKYFRWRQYTDKALEIDSVQRYRIETIDFFHLTTWILRFGGWVVINLYWFKPQRKKKNIIALKKGKRVYGDFFPTIESKDETYSNVRRFKLLFSRTFYQNLQLTCYYRF